MNFPFLIENCQKESLASLPSAGEPEDLVKRVKPRRRNEESSVREKEGDLLLTLTDERKKDKKSLEKEKRERQNEPKKLVPLVLFFSSAFVISLLLRLHSNLQV